MERFLSNMVVAAHIRIRAAVQAAGGINRIYVAYSGGKDSETVLRLTRQIYPNVVVIHNGHKGEHVEDTEGVIFVKEPKADNVPQFLKTVNLTTQIDGTRQDEDKTVIFDGIEIHRRDMPGEWTENGVWGLKISYPIWDWTDEDVLAFLKETNTPQFTDVKVSYEGEGPLLGLKTRFCRFAPDIYPRTQKNATVHSGYGVAAVYVVAEYITDGLMEWVKNLDTLVTIEVREVDLRYLTDTYNDPAFDHLQWFVSLTVGSDIGFPEFNGFLKIRVMDEGALVSCIDLANEIVEEGFKVLLMPEYEMPPTLMGRSMMACLNVIDPRVRFMPPVQNLLRID